MRTPLAGCVLSILILGLTLPACATITGGGAGATAGAVDDVLH